MPISLRNMFLAENLTNIGSGLENLNFLSYASMESINGVGDDLDLSPADPAQLHNVQRGDALNDDQNPNDVEKGSDSQVNTPPSSPTHN